MTASTEIAASECVASLPVSRGDTEAAETQRKPRPDARQPMTCDFTGAPLARQPNPVSHISNSQSLTLCASLLPPYLRAKPARFQFALSEAGFTLLEIAVALAILGLALTVLFSIFSQNVARTHVNEVRAQERALADSLLLHAEGEVSAGDSAGRTKAGLVWRVTSAPYGGSDDAKAWPQPLSQIVVTVGRTNDPREGITLRTLKLVPKAPAQ